MNGKFIVIDGMDGSGKGTQLKLLQAWLKDKLVVFTREPGGTPKAEEIREMLLKQGGPKSTSLTDAFMFWAARASHIEDCVGPALASGSHVISDRYDSSTFAFQIFGERHGDTALLSIFDAVRSALIASNEFFRPDCYIFLDLPAEVAHTRRAHDATQAKTRFDIQPLEYHERVRIGFQEFERRYENAHLVSADQAPEAVCEAIKRIIAPLIS